MASTFSNLNFHIVFSTKGRAPVVRADIRPRLYQYIGGIVRSEGGVLSEMDGTNDHVHMLVRLRPDSAIADLLRVIKSRSSGWIHETFPDSRAFAWQEGYGVFSVSESRCATVRRYIARQQAHHERQGFQAELRTLLRRHNIEFDERYIWG